MLKLLTSWYEEVHLIEQAIMKRAESGSELAILEAGCGQRWPLNLGTIKYNLTGVDLDVEALRMRAEIIKDLHKGIHGDLREIDFPEHSFDVIYSSYVLEHIDGAESVLKNFTRWLKKGGIIIILIPDPEAVRGFITRFSPHWFHVLYYKYIFGVENAGKPGYGPYPTIYDKILYRDKLQQFCAKNGLVIDVQAGDGYYQLGRGKVDLLLKVFVKLVSLLSFNKLSSDHVNLLYILRKEI
jgi:ubiquinone/menaquinone biosynthesis C-methylase UbiE